VFGQNFFLKKDLHRAPTSFRLSRLLSHSHPFPPLPTYYFHPHLPFSFLFLLFFSSSHRMSRSLLFPALVLVLVLAALTPATATFTAVQYANITNLPTSFQPAYFESVAMDGDLVVVGNVAGTSTPVSIFNCTVGISPCTSYATIPSPSGEAIVAISSSLVGVWRVWTDIIYLYNCSTPYLHIFFFIFQQRNMWAFQFRRGS